MYVDFFPRISYTDVSTSCIFEKTNWLRLCRCRTYFCGFLVLENSGMTQIIQKCTDMNLKWKWPWTRTSQFSVTPSSELRNRLPEPTSSLCLRELPLPQINTVSVLYCVASYQYCQLDLFSWAGLTSQTSAPSHRCTYGVKLLRIVRVRHKIIILQNGKR